MNRDTALLAALGVALCAFALVFAGQGFFSIDEAIYVFAADTFRLTGSLILENGSDFAPSADLRWARLLSEGPNGLTSQYPPGSAVVWAGMMSALDMRGIILFNAAATVAALFVVRALAFELFGRRRVANIAVLLFLFATFSLEYAFVLWPHMPAVLAVSLSILLFLRALGADRPVAFRRAVLSGLVLGAGLTFRLDGVLALPAIGLITILMARFPVSVLFGGAIGLLPGLAALSLANVVKFGRLNPLDYGKSEGYANLELYLPLVAGLAVGLVLLLTLRFWGSAWLARPPVRYALAVAAVLAVALVAPARDFLVSLRPGALALLLDARAIVSPLGGIEAQPDGTMSFWGLSKKALAQSMPWLGILGLLPSAALWRERGREIAIVLVFAALWSLPFVWTVWHGGMSSNMRYFLPMLPLLSVIGGWLVSGLVDRLGGNWRPFLLAGAAGFAALVVWMLATPTGLAGAHQILSLALFASTGAAALAAGLFRGAATARVAVVAVGLGVGAAVFNTLSDTALSQLRRHSTALLTDAGQGIEGRVLVYDYFFRSALQNPDQVVAIPDVFATGPDIGLIEEALREGYRVFMPEAMASEFVAAEPGFAVRASADAPLPMLEIARRGG